MGGLIALEIAHQLKANGDDVALLFLLDPMKPFKQDWPAGDRSISKAKSIGSCKWKYIFQV